MLTTKLLTEIVTKEDPFINPSVNKKRLLCNICVFSLLFLVNPFIAVIIGAGILFKAKKTLPVNLWLTYTAIWISLVNINKVPESDEIQYIKYYLSVGHESLFESIFHYGSSVKEPLYGLIQTLCYYLYGGNISIFIFTVSFISYIYLFSAIKILLISAGQGVKSVIFGVFCILFFNQFFYLSVHLIRQVMAFSIILYAIALRCRDGKTHWIPTICAPLIHTTSGLFTLLSLIPFIYKKMHFKQFLLLSLPLFAVTIGSMAFGSYMLSIMGNNALSYVFQRLSSNAGDEYKSNPMAIVIMLVPLLVISIITLYRLSKEKKTSPLYGIIHIFIFLACMVIGLSNQPLLQYRFTFVTYQMLPFILPLLPSKTSKTRNLYFLSVGTIFLLRFLITFEHSSWTYTVSTTDMLLLPLPAYYFIEP